MSATSPAPVATALARRAIATFPPASCSPMMPEPTTVASRRAVPTASAAARRARSGLIGDRARRATGGGLRAGGGALARCIDRRAAGALAPLHDRRVLLHDEDLPRVAVRILDPDLVLESVTAGGVLLAQGEQTGGLEPAAGL